jgi:hypothetical protein
MARPSFALCVVALWSSIAEAQITEPPRNEAGQHNLVTTVEHLIGPTFDTGVGADRKGASSLGVQFTRAHVWGGPVLAWLGYGSDLRAVTLGFDSLDAGLALASGEAGAAVGAGGLAVEGTIGAGFHNRGIVGIWGFGILYSFYVFEFGVSFQFPIDHARPGWLEVGQFALRLRIPLEGCDSQAVHCSRENQRAHTRR